MSENEFKKGDRVRITKRMHGSVLLGDTVTIGSEPEQHGDGYIAFEVIGCGWSGAVKVERAEDNLGDTPEHLKPLLRAAREEIPGTIVQDDGDMTPILWSPIRDHGGWYAGGLELQGYSLTTMHQSICRRDRLQRAIEQGRCYPTADARRIGREEFGMVFGDESKPQADDLNAAIHASFKTGTEGIPKPQVKIGDNVKVLMPSITWGDLVNPPSADDVRKALNRELEKMCRGVAKCKCGSTTNVNLRLGVCAACHLEKRKAEVRADLDRKVPESLAPKGWPEQFSGSSWEE